MSVAYRGRAIAKKCGSNGNDDRIGGTGHDWLLGNAGDDRLDGGDGNDVLGGGWGDDFLSGGDGNDTLFGSLGSDVLEGGAGNDTLTGGSYNDRFVFTSQDEGDDQLLDFGADDVLAIGDMMVAPPPTRRRPSPGWSTTAPTPPCRSTSMAPRTTRPISRSRS